jgi:DNA-binding NarL/FixJ family response regulator
MPLINGAEATRQIRGRLPATEVLIFTIHDDEMLVRDLLSAGARGYVLRKLHLSSSAGIVRYAIRTGLVQA